MAHRIRTGSFRDLEPRLMEAIDSLQQGHPLFPVSVLVGSNVLGGYLKYRIASQQRTVANLRFWTFLDLVSALLSGSGEGSGRPKLPLLADTMILERLLTQTTPPAVFREVSTFRGFRDALRDTFRDIRDAGMTLAEVEDLAARSARKSPDRQSHWNGLFDLYRDFRAAMGPYRDVDDDFRAAIRNSGRIRSILSGAPLLVYGFYDVTGRQEELLRSVQIHADVHYFIPFVNEEVSEFARPFVAARAQDLGTDPQAPESNIPAGSLGAMHTRNFGWGALPGRDGAAPALPADGTFALVSVPGESRTAVEILREILRAAKDGILSAWHEAAVILRNPQEEIPILAETFRLRRIPYYAHGGIPFSRRPCARAALTIAELEPAGFPRKRILRSMELIAAALPEAEASDWDVPQWRAATNEDWFLSGVDSWNRGIAALVDDAEREGLPSESEDASDDPESDRRSVTVFQARKRLASARQLARAWAALRDAAAGWPPALGWTEWAELLRERIGRLLSGSEDWPVFSDAVDRVAGLEETVNEGPSLISRERMVSVLEEALGRLAVPCGRFLRGGISLLPASAARGLRFPLVIIPGLEEGSFPARVRQDPLILDRERSSVWPARRLALKSLRREEEKLIFDMACRSAERRLVLMTSRLDEWTDRERIPSEFFLRAASAARGEPTGYGDLTPGKVPGFRSVSLDTPAPGLSDVAVDRGEIRLRLIRSVDSGRTSLLEALAREEPELLRGPLRYDRARWLPRLTEFDGHIRDPEVQSWIARTVGPAAGQVSPSRIEEYARCPYAFFLRRVMQMEKWEELKASERLDPIQRGRCVHLLLEKFVGAHANGIFREGSAEEIRRRLRRHADSVLGLCRPAGMQDLLWEITRDEILRQLDDWIDFEQDRPDRDTRRHFVEEPFGKFEAGFESPTFDVRAGRHTFRFRGKIDRIDLSRDGLLATVIDYKTGNVPASMKGAKASPLMSGEKIQLAVYRGALKVSPRFISVQKAEGEFLHLQPRSKVEPVRFSDDQLTGAQSRLKPMLEIIGDGLEQGVFYPRSHGRIRPQGHCEFCDFLQVCGKDRVRREELKAADPDVVRHGRIDAIDRQRDEG